MDRLLMISFLNQYNYGYNSEYENLTEEEKAYMDYIDKCLMEKDSRFSDACTNAMLFVLDVSSRINNDEELKDIALQKERLLSEFNQ